MIFRTTLGRGAALLAAAATLAAAGCAATEAADTAAGASSAAPAATERLQADLTGAAEVPGPGDPDGSGTGELTINTTTSEVCHKLKVANIAPAVAAHVHRGAAGEAGPPVLPLTTPAAGSSEGCSPAAADLVTDLLANPQNYYVNVHTPEHPPGAVRGQLRR